MAQLLVAGILDIGSGIHAGDALDEDVVAADLVHRRVGLVMGSSNRERVRDEPGITAFGRVPIEQLAIIIQVVRKHGRRGLQRRSIVIAGCSQNDIVVHCDRSAVCLQQQQIVGAADGELIIENVAGDTRALIGQMAQMVSVFLG